MISCRSSETGGLGKHAQLAYAKDDKAARTNGIHKPYKRAKPRTENDGLFTYLCMQLCEHQIGTFHYNQRTTPLTLLNRHIREPALALVLDPRLLPPRSPTHASLLPPLLPQLQYEHIWLWHRRSLLRGPVAGHFCRPARGHHGLHPGAIG